MPFEKSIKVNKGILGIWKLSETSEELSNIFQFSDDEKTTFEKFSGERRKVEYLATRLLLEQLTGGKVKIFHLNSGKPQIENSGLNISISHSAEYVAVFLSNENIGIDIENANRNIDKIAKRFLQTQEIEWIEKSGKQQFLKTLFWCAKEAIFKCSGQTGVQFNSQIYIPPFEFEKNVCFKGTLLAKNGNEEYKLWYINIKNNILVYCVDLQKK